MPYLEFDSDLSRVARVCDPLTANRYIVVYDNPNTLEKWLVARVLPGDVSRFKEAILAQGCYIIIANQEHGEWSSYAWLSVYRKDAPLELIAARIQKLRTNH